MADELIPAGAFKDYQPGERVTEAEYERERETLRVAINLLQEQIKDLTGVGGVNSLASEIIEARDTFASLYEKEKDQDTNITSLSSVLADREVNIKNFGAVVDGVTDDTEAVRLAIKHAEDNNLSLLIPGVSVITGELEIKKPITIRGNGPGAGYNGITNYKQTSGFLVKGEGAKRIRTRMKHRADATSPQDAPLSVALNVQAENVVLRDFSIFLDFTIETTVTNPTADPLLDSPTNYGANWDVGIFVGCRTHFYQENIHVIGYFREAGWWYDVTHATNLPRFNGLDGLPYDNTFNISGADGCTMFKCYTRGSKWGIRVAGAEPAPGFNTNSGSGAPLYYEDSVIGAVADNRGSFGFSDFNTYACSIYGTDHHTDYRRNAASGNYLTDTAGGSMSVSGLAGNSSNAIQGHRHFGTRFATFEPYTVKLDYANRVVFFGCHIEVRSSSTRKNPDGTVVDFNTQKYGLVSATTNTNNLVFHALSGALNYTYIPSTIQVHNIAPASSSSLSETTDIIKAKYFRSGNGQFISDLLEFDGRSATENDAVRLRRGNVSTFVAGVNDTTLFGNVISSRDNLDSNGSASRRWSQVYAGTGTINTSDRNAKMNIAGIPNAVLDAWSEVNYTQFKFIDAVQAKGENARLHIGLIAQEIEQAFIRHGLNAFDYGLLCYDEWPDQYDVVDGQQVLMVPAGSRYSIRPEECLMLESALMRREINLLKNL